MEEWRPIPGYEGYYEVSNEGNVRSVDRIVIRKGRKTFLRSRPMKTCVGTDGYLHFMATKHSEKKKLAVHRCVTLAFIRNPQHKQTVNHKDGNKFNNTVENLEWATHSENLSHAYTNSLRGTTLGKHIQPNLIKTIPTRQELINELREADCNMSEIARNHGITSTAVAKMCKRYGLPDHKSELISYIKRQRGATAAQCTCNASAVGANPTVGSTTLQSPGGLHDSCR